MSGQRPISTITTQDNVGIAQNGSDTSKAIDLTTKAADGVFSLQVVIGAASTSTSVTITYLLSNNGTSFVAGASAIATTVDVSSGLDALYSFEPKLAKWIKIVVTENNIGTVVGCTCTLAMQ